jgi:hypothetical protein
MGRADALTFFVEMTQVQLFRDFDFFKSEAPLVD